MTRVANEIQNGTHYIHVGGMLTELDGELPTTATITFNQLQLTNPTNIANATIPYTYRYGFNGQERELAINQSITSAEYWFYDGGLGRRWNTEPLIAKFPYLSSYACFNNNPIIYEDKKGDKGTISYYQSNDKGELKLAKEQKVNGYVYKKGSYTKYSKLPFIGEVQDIVNYTIAFDFSQTVVVNPSGVISISEAIAVGNEKSYVEGDLASEFRADFEAYEKDGYDWSLMKKPEWSKTRKASDLESWLVLNFDKDELKNIIDALASGVNQYIDKVLVTPEQRIKFQEQHKKFLERKAKDERQGEFPKNSWRCADGCGGEVHPSSHAKMKIDENGNPIDTIPIKE